VTETVRETLEDTLLLRVRSVLGDQPVTESELRGLREDVEALVRVLTGQLAASETRLDSLAADERSLLATIADELHRVEALRPRLAEARELLDELDRRARELRAEWLVRQR